MAYKDFVNGYSPTAYWPLDDASGDFADYSGNGHTLTAVSGTITYGASNLTPHTSGGSVNFAGGYGTTGHASWNDITGAWSAMAWLRSESWDFSNGRAILEKYTGTSAGYAFRYAGTTPGNHPVAFHMNLGYNEIAGGTHSLATVYFYVYTYDGTQGRIYVDGALTTGPTTLPAPASLNHAFRLAAQTDLTSSWDGDLQHVALWNGIALTSTQVSELFAGTAGGGGSGSTSNKPPLGFIPIA